MKYCCSQNDSLFLSLLSSTQWKADLWGCRPARSHEGHPRQSCCSRTTKEEEEGQKQEVMGAKQAST